MKTISEIQQEIIDEFKKMDDCFDRCACLIELSSSIISITKEKKTPEYLVKGCQSAVWLDICCSGDLFYFTADSETLIAKGILYLLQVLFCGQKCSDVATADVVFLKETSIINVLDSDRQKGIGYIINKLQNAASVHETKN